MVVYATFNIKFTTPARRFKMLHTLAYLLEEPCF